MFPFRTGGVPHVFSKCASISADGSRSSTLLPGRACNRASGSGPPEPSSNQMPIRGESASCWPSNRYSEGSSGQSGSSDGMGGCRGVARTNAGRPSSSTAVSSGAISRDSSMFSAAVTSEIPGSARKKLACSGRQSTLRKSLQSVRKGLMRRDAIRAPDRSTTMRASRLPETARNPSPRPALVDFSSPSATPSAVCHAVSHSPSSNRISASTLRASSAALPLAISEAWRIVANAVSGLPPRRKRVASPMSGSGSSGASSDAVSNAASAAPKSPQCRFANPRKT